MSKGVRPDSWGGKSHGQVYNAAQAFNSGMVTTTSKHFADQATALQEAIMATGKKIQTIVGNEWRGQAAQAVQSAYSEFFTRVNTYSENMTKFANALPEVGHAMDAAKSSIEPPTMVAAQGGLNGGGTSSADAEAAKKKAAEDEKYAREQMIRLFSNPAVEKGNSTGDITDQPGDGKGGGGSYKPGGSETGGGDSSGKNLAQTGDQIKDLDDKLGKTAPAFDRGAGEGQGQGQGSGQGAGGGTPGGGQGGGQGTGTGGTGSGLGTGSDSRNAGGYSPAIGSTTAAGLSPSTAGTGTGTGPGAGMGGLRGALGPGGLPQGTGSTGVNPAGIGAAGVRGGMMPMGMMGGAGAHSRGGKGDNDDEHEIPSYLVNLDNGTELFGNLPKASPGVIGDWTEHEEVAKRNEEALKRRYKSMGWDVKFD